MLRKMTFLAGAGVGYVLGARAGREQYEKIQEFAKKTAERPEVQQAMEKAGPLAEKVTTIASEKIPGIGGDKTEDKSAGGSSSTGSAGSSTGGGKAPAHAGAGSASGSSGSSTNGHSTTPARGTF